MTDEEKVKEYVKEKISDMKINGFTLLEIAHLSNGANIYNPKVEHLLNDKIKEAYLDGLDEGRKETLKKQKEYDDQHREEINRKARARYRKKCGLKAIKEL